VDGAVPAPHLPAHGSKECVQHARAGLRWPDITKPGNVRSQALLSKLGFAAQGESQLEGYDGPSNCWRLPL
jgi:hypothetical protein